jgi:hypothetical protein
MAGKSSVLRREEQWKVVDTVERLALGITLWCPDRGASDDAWHREIQQLAQILPKCAKAFRSAAAQLGAVVPDEPTLTSANGRRGYGRAARPHRREGKEK